MCLRIRFLAVFKYSILQTTTVSWLLVILQSCRLHSAVRFSLLWLSFGNLGYLKDRNLLFTSSPYLAVISFTAVSTDAWWIRLSASGSSVVVEQTWSEWSSDSNCVMWQSPKSVLTEGLTKNLNLSKHLQHLIEKTSAV